MGKKLKKVNAMESASVAKTWEFWGGKLPVLDVLESIFATRPVGPESVGFDPVRATVLEAKNARKIEKN